MGCSKLIYVSVLLFGGLYKTGRMKYNNDTTKMADTRVSVYRRGE